MLSLALARSLRPAAARAWCCSGASAPRSRGRKEGAAGGGDAAAWAMSGRGRDCISKDPPFSPRHHHHSSAASPAAEPRPPPASSSSPPETAHTHISGETSRRRPANLQMQPADAQAGGRTDGRRDRQTDGRTAQPGPTQPNPARPPRPFTRPRKMVLLRGPAAAKRKEVSVALTRGVSACFCFEEHGRAEGEGRRARDNKGALTCICRNAT